MKLRVAGWLLLCALACTLMAAPAMAQYPGGRHFGAYDDGHVWRDAQWWHSNNPEWMYSHHPEWVVERRDWWWYDHQHHPDWFWAPFWESYPLWTWGAPYEGVYHDYWWWHRYHPDWMYANHPEWAGPYGGWLRDDHGRHPEWFTSNYWREHPRDWAHPDKEFWRGEDGRFKNYLNEHPERRSKAREERPGGAHGQEHMASSAAPNTRAARTAKNTWASSTAKNHGRRARPRTHGAVEHGPEHAGGPERGAHPSGAHPNEASRGPTHNAPHAEQHEESHHGGGGASGGERERK